MLGKDDLLIKWNKPKRSKASSYSETDWETLPETLTLRQIKVTVDQPGFRVKAFHIVTTLLDAREYPSNEIADLYFQRWDVELFFRDIKTTMEMDILRCKSPHMVRKEIVMTFIAYNCIRHLMNEVAQKHNKKARHISFKGSVQALRQWEPYLNQTPMNKQKRQRLLAVLYAAISGNVILERPGRSEPRAVNRRPKPYQLLTAPRHEMKEIPHRGKYRAKAA